ncbi:hypothetical protein N7512_007098 [Penicillium capsulatum]|nr:hypothetical protein N7512_007098 [Penicillium capsulatum]
MTDFKVIIVGGSVAGLTLANILDRYAIDYVVLEKHGDIAPQLGASLGLLPYGAKILDQLGILARLEAISMRIDNIHFHGPDGLPLIAPLPTGMMLRELLGYAYIFLDRRNLIQVLFDSLSDKSKIRTSCEVSTITALDGRTQVILKDGTSVEGDILVGADGVHSSLRNEMWRIAEIETPSYNANQISKAITGTYKCIFGTTKRPAAISNYTMIKTFHKGRSYLCCAGPDGKMYFFGFFKTPKRFIYGDIPRYSVAEAHSSIAEYAHDILLPGITVGDICEQNTNLGLVPLEEYVLEKCFYKRATLIGDSFHKINPLTGHGGNSAIESAAVLADLLKDELKKNPKPNDPAIRRVFKEFQECRRPRATSLMEMTQQIQDMEVLDDPLLEFMQLTVMHQMGHEHFASALAAASTPGLGLKYMPPSNRKGITPYNEEVQANPCTRSTVATGLWAALMLAIALLSPALTGLWIYKAGVSEQSRDLQTYHATSSLAINAFWIVESYRPGLFITTMFSSIPYILAAFTCGWEITAPLYFALHIYHSQKDDFYYPSPRAINLWVAKALPIIFLLAFLATFIQSMIWPGDPVILCLVHISLPVLIHWGKRFYASASAGKPTFQLAFTDMDMKDLSRLFTTIFLFSSAAHLHFVAGILRQSASDLARSRITLTPEWIQLVCLALAITTWCSFVVWDMRRVNLTQTSTSLVFLGAALGCILLGPAAMLAALWRWREPALERGRRRHSQCPTTK